MNAWKAVVRLAARDARRGRGRSLLVALMVLVPVMLATVGSVVARSSQLEPRDVVALSLGTGAVQARVTGDLGANRVEQNLTGDQTATFGDSQSPTLPTVAEVEQRLQAVVGPRNRLVRQTYAGQQAFQVGDGALRADVVELDVAALGAGSTVSLVSGRLPATDGEIAAMVQGDGRPVAAVGTRLTAFTGRSPGSVYTVVGTYRSADLIGFAGLLARPGALIEPVTARTQTYGSFAEGWWVVGPDPVTWAQVQRVNDFGGVVLSRAAVAENPRIDLTNVSPVRVGTEAVVTAVVVVALLVLQIMLMVGPAIAVGARRNERLLALLGANGGTPRHLAGAVLAGAGVAGLAGSLAGAVLGVGAGAALVRVLDATGRSVLPRVQVNPWDVTGLVLAGTLTAVLAGVLPALRVARIDVVAALTGRRTQAAPRLRVPAAGLVVFAAGAALAWWAAGDRFQSGVVLGIAVAEVGLVVAASAVVSLFARLARRAPLSARLALRDAARHRGRTAPALAATVAAVAAATSFVVFGASQLDVQERAWRPQAAVGTGIVPLFASDGVDPGAVESTVRTGLGPADVTYGYQPAQPTDGGLGSDVGILLPGRCDHRGCSDTGVGALFLDPAGAALVAPDGQQARDALEAGRAVVYDRQLLDADGTVTLTVSTYSADPSEREVRLPAQLADSSQKLDVVLLPRDAAATLGVTVVPQLLYVRPATAPSAADRARLDLALAKIDPNLGYSVQGDRPTSGTDTVVYVMVALAVLAALAGTFIAVGLAAADARPALGTLAAVGADPSVRRRIGAGQAAAVAVPGALVGVLAGILAGWVLVRLNGGNGAYGIVPWRLVVPPGQTALLLLGVPALAIALGWLTVRSRLEVVRRLGE